jgi:hypothetical protein
MLFVLVLLSSTLLAQNEVLVFSEDGEKFILHVNGQQVNESPSTRVLKSGISESNAMLRIVFDEDIAPDLKKSFSFLEKDVRVSAKITMTKKGYKLRYFGEEPITNDELFVAEEQVQYEGSVGESTEVYELEEKNTSSGTAILQTTSTTTTAGDPVEGENVSMNIGINGFNMNVDVKIDEGEMGMQQEINSSTTATTRTTSGSIDAHQDYEIATHDYEEEVEYVTEAETQQNCFPPMGDSNSIRVAMDGESFADDQMVVAKQAIKRACLSVEEVKDLAAVFTFEDDRLEFLMFCYDRTHDVQNYYKVNEVLTFSASKEELNTFLDSK